MIHVMSNITEQTLTGPNYLEWSKRIRIFLRSVSKDDHLTEDPPKDDKEWLRDDAKLFLQIMITIDTEVVNLVNHCEYGKELMDYLEFLYSGKGNLSRMFDVCKEFYRIERNGEPVQTYFMEFKKVCEELNVLLPFNPDVKVQQTQREKLAIMSFLVGLGSPFEAVISHILSDTYISSLSEVFARVLRTETTTCATSIRVSSGLVSRNHASEHGRSTNPSFTRGNNRPNDSGGVECNYCHELGHIKRYCPKLMNKLNKSQSVQTYWSHRFSATRGRLGLQKAILIFSVFRFYFGFLLVLVFGI